MSSGDDAIDAFSYVLDLFAQFMQEKGIDVKGDIFEGGEDGFLTKTLHDFVPIASVILHNMLLSMEHNAIDRDVVNEFYEPFTYMKNLNIIAANMQIGMLFGISVAYALETGFISELMNKLDI